jgi:hypothetical protein
MSEAIVASAALLAVKEAFALLNRRLDELKAQREAIAAANHADLLTEYHRTSQLVHQVHDRVMSEDQ